MIHKRAMRKLVDMVDIRGVIRVPNKGIIHPKDRDRVLVRKDLKDIVSHVLISPSYISERIRALAEDIVEEADRKKARELQIVIVLKGASVFANTLAQEIFERGGPPVRFNYIKASSYGNEIVSTGNVSISGQVPYIKGRDLLILEDIVDTGLTLVKLKEYFLKERGASSVEICALLDKRARRIPSVGRSLKIDHTGFRVPDMFVAGYGIDCAEHLRELPYIVAVKQEYFINKSRARGE